MVANAPQRPRQVRCEIGILDVWAPVFWGTNGDVCWEYCKPMKHIRTGPELAKMSNGSMFLDKNVYGLIGSLHTSWGAVKFINILVWGCGGGGVRVCVDPWSPYGPYVAYGPCVPNFPNMNAAAGQNSARKSPKVQQQAVRY